jgi:hypothetical protein
MEEHPPYGLNITKVDNGYIAEDLSDHKITVFEESERDELKDIEALLWFVLEFFGKYGSKHDPERIRIIRQRKDSEE